MARRAAKGASAGECLFTMAEVLRERSLTLCQAWRARVLERLLTALPFNTYNPSISLYLSAALLRMPLLNEALLAQWDKSRSAEDATVHLLSSYCLGAGAAAITQNNLKVPYSKAKATLATTGKPGSNKYDRVQGTGVAPHASTSGMSGDARHRFNAVAFETIVQSLTGDSEADMCSLLRTLYSIIRSIFTGKQSPTTTELLSRAAALSSGFAVYADRCIVKSDVCCAGPQLDAALSESVVRSFLHGTIFVDMQSLCKLLVALKCRPYDEFERLAAPGGIPSQEALTRMFKGTTCCSRTWVRGVAGLLQQPAHPPRDQRQGTPEPHKHVCPVRLAGAQQRA
jgi:hypothetical protein